MYPNIETSVSQGYLSQILNGVSQPPCLIGGWAVYYTVNDNFRKNKMHDYQGSRDIDLGFHFDPNWTRKQFQSSSYNATIIKLRKMGFEEVSYRYFKQHSMEDGHQLTLEEAKTTDQFMIFNMYVDLLVDAKNPKRAMKIAGSTVLEEPLLSAVFSGKESTQRKLFGIRVTMPGPHLLTKIKLKSFPGRPEEDKKSKTSWISAHYSNIQVKSLLISPAPKLTKRFEITTLIPWMTYQTKAGKQSLDLWTLTLLSSKGLLDEFRACYLIFQLSDICFGDNCLRQQISPKTETNRRFAPTSTIPARGYLFLGTHNKL